MYPKGVIKLLLQHGATTEAELDGVVDIGPPSLCEEAFGWKNNWKAYCSFTSAISIAATTGDATTFEALLEHGARLDVLTHDGTPPLLAAAKNGHSEITRALLEWSAKTGVDSKIDHICNRFDEGPSALTLATQHGHFEVAKALLEFGAPARVTTFDDCRSPQNTALLRICD